jgi:hypothetical protein
MLTFKLLITNDVDLWKSLLTSVLTFKSLAINDVALVDLYMRICVYDCSHDQGSCQNTHLTNPALCNHALIPLKTAKNLTFNLQ